MNYHGPYRKPLRRWRKHTVVEETMEHLCLWCHEWFEPVRTDQLYCCRAHSMKAYAKRRKEKKDDN